MISSSIYMGHSLLACSIDNSIALDATVWHEVNEIATIAITEAMLMRMTDLTLFI